MWYFCLEDFVEGGRIDAVEDGTEAFQKLLFVSGHLCHRMAGHEVNRRSVLQIRRQIFCAIVAKYPSTFVEELCDHSSLLGIVAKRDFRPIHWNVGLINAEARRVAGFQLIEHILETIHQIFKQKLVVSDGIGTPFPWIGSFDRSG